MKKIFYILAVLSGALILYWSMGDGRALTMLAVISVLGFCGGWAAGYVAGRGN